MAVRRIVTFIMLLGIGSVQGAGDPGCGTITRLTITGDSGVVVSSPDYPDMSWAYGYVCWIVQCSAPSTMEIELKSLYTSSSSDVMSFYDGYVSQTLIGDVQATLSSTVQWQYYSSTSQELFITFYSNPSHVHNKNFQLCVYLAGGTKYCNYIGATTTTPQPNYPGATTTTPQPNEDCGCGGSVEVTSAPRSGLSGGATAGIVIGSIVFLFGLIITPALLVVYDKCKCKRSTSVKSTEEDARGPHQTEMASTSNTHVIQSYGKHVIPPIPAASPKHTGPSHPINNVINNKPGVMLPPISPHNPNPALPPIKTVQPAPAPGPADVSYRHHPWGGTAPGVGETHSIPADQHMKTAQPAVPPGNIYNPNPRLAPSAPTAPLESTSAYMHVPVVPPAPQVAPLQHVIPLPQVAPLPHVMSLPQVAPLPHVAPLPPYADPPPPYTQVPMVPPPYPGPSHTSSYPIELPPKEQHPNHQ